MQNTSSGKYLDSINVLLVLALSLACSVVYANDSMNTSMLEINKTKKGKVPSQYLTVMGFTIGKNTLKDVTAKLGPVRASAPGEVCYVSIDPADQTRVIFRADSVGRGGCNSGN